MLLPGVTASLLAQGLPSKLIQDTLRPGCAASSHPLGWSCIDPP